MPGRRAVVLALAVGIGITVYFSVWSGWPTFVAVAVGATMAVVMLLIAASLAEDPAAADAAWRAAAPDLAARERSADEPRAEAAHAPRADARSGGDPTDVAATPDGAPGAVGRP